jgi:hypothetical protein
MRKSLLILACLSLAAPVSAQSSMYSAFDNEVMTGREIRQVTDMAATLCPLHNSMPTGTKLASMAEDRGLSRVQTWLMLSMCITYSNGILSGMEKMGRLVR